MHVIRTCPCCKASITLEDLLTSPDIVPIGMLLQDDQASWNSYYFNHTAEDCGSTFTINVETFASLLNEPIPASIRTGSCDCEGRCTSLKDLAHCGAECHWAPYRRFLQVLVSRKMPVAT